MYVTLTRGSVKKAGYVGWAMAHHSTYPVRGAGSGSASGGPPPLHHHRQFFRRLDIDRQGIVAHRQADLAATGELAEQQFVGECALDVILDHARHWPRAHLRVETVFGEPATRLAVDVQHDLLLVQLRLELDDELVDHAQDMLEIERMELHDRIEAIAEFGRERLADRLHRVGRVVLFDEADRAPRRELRTRVRGHHQDHVAEVR